MEDIIKRLRSFYYLVSLPSLALFILALITADVPLVDDQIRYIILVALYFVALVSIPLTSFNMRRAISKSENLPEEQQIPMLTKAYKKRIIAVCIVAYLCSPIYVITVERGCSYMMIIVTIMLLLLYPTKQLVFHKIDE